MPDNQSSSSHGRVSPRESLDKAWEVAVAPREYSKRDVKELFDRGFGTYENENGVRDETQLADDLEEFVIDAIYEEERESISDDPWVDVDKPGRLVVLLAFGTAIIKRNPRFEGIKHRVELHKTVRKAFFEHLLVALNEYRNANDLQYTAAEKVYARNEEDDRGPPAGRVLEDIVEVDGRPYFKIPLVQVSRKCLVRAGDPVDGPIRTLVNNNCAYVPADDFDNKFEDHVLGKWGSARYFETMLEQILQEGQLEEMVSMTEAVDEEIDKFDSTNNTEKIFGERKYPPKLRVILDAVEAAPSDEVMLGEAYKSKELFEAIEEYKEVVDNKWDLRQLNEISSPQTVAQILTEHSDHQHVEIIENAGEKQVNKYELSYAPGYAKRVEVSEIEDILELPCMSNIDEHLQEEKPVRWVLYTYVRVILSHSQEFDVDDIVEFFRRYPWFDKATSKYQIQYEKERRMADGSIPKPIGCNNDNRNFSQFCIGKENCDYSIYGSLDFRDKVLDDMPDESSRLLQHND